MLQRSMINMTKPSLYSSEHPDLFTKRNFWQSSIQETVRLRKWNPCKINKLIVILVKVIGLKVFLTRLCGFTFSIFWVMQPTRVKNIPNNLYWNKCLMCFLCSWLNLDMSIIKTWWVCVFSLIISTYMYILRFQIQLENTSLQFSLNLLSYIMLVFIGRSKIKIKVSLMLMKHVLIGVNMFYGTMQQSVTTFTARFLDIFCNFTSR